MSNLITTQVNQLAEKFAIPESSELVSVLKATAFKGQVSDAQMSALLIVANQYNLNPWTKEIYAFPDKNNGIVPVVGVDGWARIINGNPQFDGMKFEQDDDSCTCKIFRKDRNHPIEITEYMSECKRAAGPWQSHPKRMLRHKAMIQCARLAFGFVGIYEPDEAERIQEGMKDINERPKSASAIAQNAISSAASTMDDEDRHKLLADLEAVADTGIEALQKSWESIGPEKRKALAGNLQSLKDRAAMVIEG